VTALDDAKDRLLILLVNSRNLYGLVKTQAGFLSLVLVLHDECERECGRLARLSHLENRVEGEGIELSQERGDVFDRLILGLDCDVVPNFQTDFKLFF